jgi:hypothetical protein
MGSDPDMMMKLWHSGVRYYKGVSASRVYHFRSKTTARVRKNNGYNQFLLKWGFSNSTLFKFILRMGTPFSGMLTDPSSTTALSNKKRVDKLKRFWAVVKNNQA